MQGRVTAPPAHHPGSLAASVLQGFRWKATSQAVELGTRTVVALVLARLLGPREFGLAGMAVAFSALGQAFADAAVTSAVVQRRDLTDVDRSTAFWISLGAGAGLTLLGVATSGLVAGFFDESRVQALFAALSCGFLLAAVSALPSALLTRALDFRRLELCGMVGVVTGAVVAVAAAIRGAGAGAIVAQRLVSLAVTGALLWLATSWRPAPVFSRASLRALGGFGLNVLGSRLFFYLQRNADNLLVGRVLGASALGAYALAYNLVLLPFTQLVDPLRSVLFPVFSAIQADRARVGALWLRSTRVLAAALLPAMLGLMVVASDFVAVVLGTRWETAIAPIHVLAVVGMAQSLIGVNSVVLTAIGRTGPLLRFSILTFVLSLVGFAVGVRWGVVGVAVGYLAANAVIVPVYLRLTAHALGLGLRHLAAALAGVTQAAAVTLVCLLTVRLILVAFDVPSGARLGAVSLTGVIVAAALAVRRIPELRAELGVVRRALARRPLV
jgi:O-antigen/teichoic acid export membrane protein